MKEELTAKPWYNFSVFWLRRRLAECIIHMSVLSNCKLYMDAVYSMEIQLSSVQSLSRVQLLATPWTTACQASLSITNSWSLPKLMSIESVISSNHLILCHPLLLLPSTFPSMSLFKWVSSSHQVAKVLEFQLQHQSFQWIFWTDFL